MKRKTLIFASALFTFVPAMYADLLSVAPTAQNRFLGQQATVDIVYSGNYVGDFDINISWTGTILSLVSANFGTQLGGPLDSIQGTAGANPLNVFQVSFLDVVTLQGLQPGKTVTLMTLVWDTIGLGTSPIDLSVNAIGNELGDALSPTLVAGSVTVLPQQTGVIPEPTSILLLATAAGLVGWRLRKAKA